MSWAGSEKELAKHLGPWLDEREWKPYPEVSLQQGEPIADWVAVRENLAAVFECKLTMSVVLIRQAFYWTQKADYVSIVLPVPKNKNAKEEREKCYPMLQRLGLGLIEVSKPKDGKAEITVRLNATRQLPFQSSQIVATVCDGHRDIGQPGTKDGARWSEFQQTVRNMQRYLLENPGSHLKEVIRGIDHHYQTNQKAIQKILTIMEKDGLRGIRTERDSGLMRLFVTDEMAKELGRIDGEKKE